jgi:acyl carrier protein
MPKNNALNLEEDLKQLISKIIGKSPKELKPDANFWKDLEVDSVKAIEMVVAIEKQYKITIREEQIPKVSNLREVVELVKQALEKKDTK